MPHGRRAAWRGGLRGLRGALRESGLEEIVRLTISESRPFLGICVGLQLLFESSEEDPDEPGLGILAGTVRSIPAGERRPQMQWNIVRQVGGTRSRLLGDDPSQLVLLRALLLAGPKGADATAAVVGTCDYGGEIPSCSSGERVRHPVPPREVGVCRAPPARAVRTALCRPRRGGRDLAAVARHRYPGRQVRAPAARDSSRPRPSTETRSSRPRRSWRPEPHACTWSTLTPPGRGLVQPAGRPAHRLVGRGAGTGRGRRP